MTQAEIGHHFHQRLNRKLTEHNIEIDEIQIPLFEYSTETLLDLSSKIFINNIDILVSYIKWLIEFANLMPILSWNETLHKQENIKYVFWHPNEFSVDKFGKLNDDKKYIMQKLKLYKHLYYPLQIHSIYTEIDCKFCINKFETF